MLIKVGEKITTYPDIIDESSGGGGSRGVK